jgi:hypothetical protein
MAKNGVVATKLTKEDLKATAAGDPGLVRAIMQSLAKRHYYNIIKIGDINEKAVRKMLSEEESKKVRRSWDRRRNPHTLKDRIMDAIKNRDYSFMKDCGLPLAFRKWISASLSRLEVMLQVGKDLDMRFSLGAVFFHSIFFLMESSFSLTSSCGPQ